MARGLSVRASSRARSFAGWGARRRWHWPVSTFPICLRGPLFSGREPASGMEVVEQLGGGRAVVSDKATGRKLLALSSVPLQARTPSGSLAPLDLSLTQQDGRLAARNPAVAVDFPQSGVPGVALPQRGFALALAGGQTRRAQVADDRVFYASTLADTDVFAGATPTGAEVALQLRSPESPERFVFDVELPDGALVRRARTDDPIPGDPPQSLEVARGDEVLGYVRTPQAHDADGRSLAVAMRAEGDRIVLDVPHRDGEVRYPALVDPEVVHVANRWEGYEGWNWSQDLKGQAPGPNTNFGAALGDCAYGCHYYTSMPTDHWFNHGAYAHFWLRSPVGTFLARSENHNIGHKPFYSSAFQGIMNPSYSAWEHVWSGFHEYWGVRHDFGGWGEENYALFGIGAHNPGGGVWTGANKAWVSMETNVVFLGDRHAPVAWGSAVNQDWHDDGGVEHVYSARTRDHGLGVGGISLTGPPSGGGTVSTSCSGDPYRQACPRDQDWGHDYRYRLNEGTTNFELVSRDVVGNQSQTHRWAQNIDRTPPRLTPTGSLWDARERDDDNRFEGLYNDTYPLRVDASDAHSGVRDIEVLIDGVSQRDRGGYTTASTLDWTLRPDNYSDGEHTVQIVVRDRVAGQTGIAEGRHTTKQTFRVVIDRRGDVYTAKEYDGDFASGGEFVATERHRLGTTLARRDEEGFVATRRVTVCSQQLDQCGEVRQLADAEPEESDPQHLTVQLGRSVDDPVLDPVAAIRQPATEDLGPPAATGSMVGLLRPWQTPPPAHSSQFERYDEVELADVDGQDHVLSRRLYLDAATKLPVRETNLVGSEVESDLFYSYSSQRHELGELPSDEFAVGMTDPNGETVNEDFATDPPPEEPADPLVDEPEVDLESAIAFRRDHGLNADPVLVQSLLGGSGELYERAMAEYGQPLTAEEKAELDERDVAAEAIVDVIDKYAEQNAPDSYAGAWIDQENGGLVRVGFTRDPDIHLNRLKELFPLPDRLRAFTADLTAEQLDALTERIDLEAAQAEGIDINSVYPDLSDNTVKVGVDLPTPELEAKLRAQYGDNITLRRQGAAVPQQSRSEGSRLRIRRFIPPVYGGLQTYRFFGGNCSTGFSVRRGRRYRVLTAGHCGSRGSIWFRLSRGRNFPIGKMTADAGPGNFRDSAGRVRGIDVGQIRVPRRYATSRIYVRPGEKNAYRRMKRQISVGNPQGRTICMVGYRKTPPRCNRLVSNKARIRVSRNLVFGRMGVWKPSDTRAGDSGGAVYRRNTAFGVHFGLSAYTNERVYTPMGTVTARFGTRLVGTR